MSVRSPEGLPSLLSAETNLDAMGQEILAEKAASLGQAGRKVELCLERLRSYEGDGERRAMLRSDAAAAVYAYFIQRELCGFRRHDDVIRDYKIPREVLVRLGAR